MNDGNIGYSFTPGQDQKRLLAGINRGGQLGPMANAALKVLSLRLPNVLGGSPISPAQLLQSKVGAGGAMGGLGQTQATAPAPASLPTADASGSLNVANFDSPGFNVQPSPFPSARPDAGSGFVSGGGGGSKTTIGFGSTPGDTTGSTGGVTPPPDADLAEILRRVFSGSGIGGGPIQNLG